MNIRLLIYLFFILICKHLPANDRTLPSITLDTLPGATYQGNRLHISNIGIYQVKPNWMRIQYVATNTGSQAIEINKKNPLPNLNIGFDQSLYTNHLENYADQIRKVLILQKTSLQPGERSDVKYVKFYTNAAKYQQEEVIAEIVDKAPPLAEPRKTKNVPEEKLMAKTPDSSAAAAPPTRISTEDLLNEKETCPDLIIGNLNVIEKNKKFITLEYTITNQGKGPANLFGENNHKEDNAAVVAYMSGSSNLSRGAINLKGEYITNGMGTLKPHESQKRVIKLDIRAKTRYTPVIILSLDTFRTVKECDRTNNTSHIVLK